jgi:hypothetical protein
MRQQPPVMRSNEVSTWTASSMGGPVSVGARLPLGSDAFLSPLNDVSFERKPRRFGRLAIFVISGTALVWTTMVATALMLRASRDSAPNYIAARPPVADSPRQLLAAGPSAKAAAPVQEPAPIEATSTPVASDAVPASEPEAPVAVAAKRHRRGDRRVSKRGALHRESAATSATHERSTRDDIVADLLQTKPQRGHSSRRRSQTLGAMRDGQSRHNTSERADRDG